SFHHHSVFTNASYQLFLTNNAPLLKNTVTSPMVEQEPGETASDELREIAARVEEHLSLHNSYTNPELTLTALAAEMGVSGNKISSAINKVLKKNFFELINE